MADFVELLVSHPGVYIGPQTEPEPRPGSSPGVARIEVTPLPGGSGVMLAYEVLRGDGVGHHEHAVLARAGHHHVLVTSHSHADVTTVLHESEPGYFTPDEDDAPFPMAIRVEVPEAGHLVYSWSYGWDKEPLRSATSATCGSSRRWPDRSVPPRSSVLLVAREGAHDVLATLAGARRPVQ